MIIAWSVTKYTILLVTTPNIWHCSSGTKYTIILGHGTKYNTVSWHTPNITALLSHFMPQCVPKCPHCFPDDCFWSVAELTGISPKCSLPWLVIQPAIETLPCCVFWSQVGTRSSQMSGQRLKSEGERQWQRIDLQ